MSGPLDRKTKAERRIARAGRVVKVRILAAGIPHRKLAEAAGISRPWLSHHLSGRYQKPEVQLAIWRAYMKLAGERLTLADFWGDLLSERIQAA